MTKLLVLDAGHGGKDPGATFGSLKEKTLTLMIAKETRDILKGYDVKVILTRETDVFLELGSRATIANMQGADLFVSIHINAGGGTGYEDYIDSALADTSGTNLKRVLFHDEFVKNMPFAKNRGMKKNIYTVLRNTKMDAILTESGFIDNAKDRVILEHRSNISRIANAHALGIVKAMGLKKIKKKETIETIHYVQSGESMYGISKQYNTTVDKIMTLNPKFKDASKIHVGDKLRVK